MDSLINILENFSLNPTNFDDSLDVMITKMNNLSVLPEDFEWYKISENYSKLKYLNKLINDYPVKGVKLDECLTFFLKDLDKANEYYLREIKWDEERYYLNQALKIEHMLEHSFDIQNPYDKLSYIIETYDNFIPLIESNLGEYKKT